MKAGETAIVVSTYLPDEFRCYDKSISMVEGETLKSAFERASKVPFEIPGSHLSEPEDTVSHTDADYMDRLWLLGITCKRKLLVSVKAMVKTQAQRQSMLSPGF
jgi:hypothetical protein